MRTIPFIRDTEGDPIYLDLPDDLSLEVAEQVISLVTMLESQRRDVPDVDAVLERLAKFRIQVADMYEIQVQW